MSTDKPDAWKSPEIAVKFAEDFRPLGLTEPKAKNIPALFSLVKQYIFFNVLTSYRVIFYPTLNGKHFNYMSQFLLYNKHSQIQ